jgi:hypothetical protein
VTTDLADRAGDAAEDASAGSDRPRVGLAPTLGLVGLLILGLALGVALTGSDPFTLLFYAAYASVGAILVYRRPRNPIGWLLIAISFGFIGTSTTPDVTAAALAAGTVGFWGMLSVWVASWAGSADFLAYFALVLVFPSGHLPGGRWRVPSRLLLLFGVVFVVLTAVAPTIGFTVNGGLESIKIQNPLAVLPDLPLWSVMPASDTAILPIIGMLVVAVGSIIVRYRRSTGILRLQLRWLVAAMTFVVGALLAGLASLALTAGGIGGLAWVPAVFAYPTVPIAIGVAVLRYRLLEIDRIVSRTVAYALVTGILAVVFAGTILLLETALTTITEVQTIAVAASTLAVFALFQPLRRRVQRTVDRRFDRARYDAERTSISFAERLRNEVDMTTVSDDLRATVSGAMAPTHLGVWVRGSHG